jgi:hypothetical protein
MALYEQVRTYVKRSFGAVTRCPAWRALPVAKQQEIMKDLQVGVHHLESSLKIREQDEPGVEQGVHD